MAAEPFAGTLLPPPMTGVTLHSHVHYMGLYPQKFPPGPSPVLRCLWVFINYESDMDAVYVYVVALSEFPIVLSYPHYSHAVPPQSPPACVSPLGPDGP